jgi:hypothetical protein
MKGIAALSMGTMEADRECFREPDVAARVEALRASRYEIGMAIRYRVRGEGEWRQGVTENISMSGMLVRTNCSLNKQTAIEMRFFLPLELHDECAAEIFCRGTVVRSSDCTADAGAAFFAARILNSRFLRRAN